MIKSNPKIKLLVMDVDGTLTDGKINCAANGELFKSFSVKDGFAIAHILPKHKIIPVIITGRTSEIVKTRAKEINIVELHQGIDDKLAVLSEVVKKYNCELQNVAYIGDDINDLECMKKCGLSACPSDAVNEVKAISDFVSTFSGGNGAAREFIDWLVRGANNE